MIEVINKLNIIVKETPGDIISLSIVPDNNGNGLAKSLLLENWGTSVNENHNYEVMSSPEFQFKADEPLDFGNESMKQTAKFWEHSQKPAKNSKSKHIKKSKTNKVVKLKEHKPNKINIRAK